MPVLSKIFNHLFPKPEEVAFSHSLFDGRRLLKLLFSFVQVSILFAVLHNLNITPESGISNVSYLILGYFLVYNFTPLRIKPFVFLLISLTIIYYAFGWFSGTLMICIGFIIILACHLPVNFWLRLLIISAIFIGLAAVRLNLFYAPRVATITPYVASCFMFRIILYLHEMKYSKDLKSTFFQKISYFFLFPNQLFLLFPIVDYKLFIKSYFNKDEKDLWQKGIRWMLRGLVHLIVYRYINNELFISKEEVTGLSALLLYSTSTYLLVLRLSGMFHLVIGLLCLFGFNLPPVFNNYFLATDFVNLWSRINVYWRDFVMKIFFYPLVFWLKKRNIKNTLPIAIVIIFVATWFFHNYQWFWIRGYFPLTVTDMLFWGIIGLSVMINTMWRARPVKNRKIKKTTHWSFYPTSILKMISMFFFMATLWSLWSSSSLNEWMFLLSKAGVFTLNELLYVVLTLLLIVILGSLIYYLIQKTSLKNLLSLAPEKTALLTFPSLILLFFSTSPKFNDLMPAQVQNLVTSINPSETTQEQRKEFERGYYEKLIDGETNDIQSLWEVKIKRPKTFTPLDQIAIRTTDLMTRVLKPNQDLTLNGIHVSTNSAGLRDDEYTQVKPERTLRIALLGGSYEMGMGVKKENIFEHLIEERLNENNTQEKYNKYEIINFSMGGYHLFQHVEQVNSVVFDFNPDVLILMAHTEDKRRFLRFFTDLIQNSVDLKYPVLKEIKENSGVRQTMSRIEIKERLTPYVSEGIEWAYQQIAKKALANNCQPLWIYLPAAADEFVLSEFNELESYAEKSEFHTISLNGIYENMNVDSLQLSNWDAHLNEDGHKLIANKLYKELNLYLEKSN